MRGVLLGLVLERPGHGGDLANRMLTRLGENWRMDTNDVYRLLEQLEQEELTVSREQSRQQQRARHDARLSPHSKTSHALSSGWRRCYRASPCASACTPSSPLRVPRTLPV